MKFLKSLIATSGNQDDNPHISTRMAKPPWKYILPMIAQTARSPICRPNKRAIRIYPQKIP
jgi:hypothetical protein